MAQSITLHDIVEQLESMLDDAAAQGAPEIATHIGDVIHCVSLAASDRAIGAESRMRGNIARAVEYEQSAERQFAAARALMAPLPHVVLNGEESAPTCQT